MKKALVAIASEPQHVDALVAAAGGEGALSPRAAWMLGLTLVIGLAALVAVGPYASDFGLARMTVSPEVLRDRARSLLERFGYHRDVLDRASWLERVYPPMLHLARTTPSTEWRATWRLGPPVHLSLRQSPAWMSARDPNGLITADDPPFEVSDMSMITVSAEGRLRYLRAVPPEVDTSMAATPFAWPTLFEAAGLDTASFRLVAPTWVPPSACDAQAEWVGTIPPLPGVQLRVAAAAFRGRPVYFRILGPWSRPERIQRRLPSPSQRVAGWTIGFVSLVSAVMALVLWRRNRKLGRGDSKGATRLAGTLFVLSLLQWLASAHHVPSIEHEARSFLAACAQGLMFAALAAVVYLAVEPYVRRRMPELMIGWARLVEGRLRDPRVGRDVLAGAVMGTTSALIFHASNALPTWIPIFGQTTVFPHPWFLEGGGRLIGALLFVASTSLVTALAMFFLLFLLRLALKREWLGLVAMMILMTLTNLGAENVALETPFAVLQGVLMTWALGRVGLLAAATMWFYRIVFVSVPLPVHGSAPYLIPTLLVFALMLGLAAYAMKVSVGSRLLFAAPDLDA